MLVIKSLLLKEYIYIRKLRDRISVVSELQARKDELRECQLEWHRPFVSRIINSLLTKLLISGFIPAREDTIEFYLDLFYNFFIFLSILNIFDYLVITSLHSWSNVPDFQALIRIRKLRKYQVKICRFY